MTDRTPKERLYWLMDLFMNNNIDSRNFCDEFHRTYEFEIEDGDLSNEEKNNFMKVSQQTARFTDIKEDLIQYPNVYISDKDLINTVKEVLTQLLN